MSDDAGDDPEPGAVAATVAALQRRFPGVVVWYGRRTARWWALLPPSERGLLLEGGTPEQLIQAIATARAWHSQS